MKTASRKGAQSIFLRSVFEAGPEFMRSGQVNRVTSRIQMR